MHFPELLLILFTSLQSLSFKSVLISNSDTQIFMMARLFKKSYIYSTERKLTASKEPKVWQGIQLNPISVPVISIVSKL
jgi:hypothetical protein